MIRSDATDFIDSLEEDAVPHASVSLHESHSTCSSQAS
jgi:hypothetical protein